MTREKIVGTISNFPRNKKLFCFGFGYTATALSVHLVRYGWSIGGTTTNDEKCSLLKENGIDAIVFDKTHPIFAPDDLLQDTTHILLSIPPGESGDIVFEFHGQELAALPNLEWIGYLSTISVYGNHDGQWVDENMQASPINRRGSLRRKAEQQWEGLFLSGTFPLHTFRLSGIYGPGRSALDVVRAGQARRINKEGHVFNRMYIDDIIQVLLASIEHPHSGEIYNLADDAPVPSHEVIKYACELLGMDVPPLTPYDEVDYLAPIVRSFYQDNKRIKNDKIKNELNIGLLYPDYKAGLKACFAIEKDLLST